MKKILLTVLFIGILTFEYAAYIKYMPVELDLPNGTVLKCFASGDEFFNWLHDDQGYTIIKNGKDGYYYYAKKENEKIIASEYRVNTVDPADIEIDKWLVISENEILKRKEKYRADAKPLSTTDMHTGQLNNIVVFIRFSDDAEFTGPRLDYINKFNHTSESSLYSYYKEVSYGQLDIVSTFYPQCSPEVSLSYQDDHPRAYFQVYDANSNPIGYQDYTERRNREHQLLADAINSISHQVPVDLVIDKNNDNYVDNVCFIVKGNAEGWNELLWAHQWGLGIETYINNKRVLGYTFQPQNQFALHTLVHEMFHTLGAPDLYHYSFDGFDPVGSWDIMEWGSGHMGAHMKYKYANGDWIENIPELDTDGTYQINPLTSAINNCYKIYSPYSDDEYLVVEFRKEEGLFETNIPGTGLLIYRVNANLNGNAHGPPDEVYIFRPDGTLESNGNESDAFFSDAIGRVEFDDYTNPAAFQQNGDPLGIKISNIAINENTASFTLKFQTVLNPDTFEAHASSSSQNDLSWTKNANDDEVLIAWSGNDNFGRPIRGTSYAAGNDIDGGGQILYCGDLNTFVHAGLAEATAYYYKIWSMTETFEYSLGITLQSNTECNPIYEIPYVNDFSTGHLPVCWDIIDNLANGFCWAFENPGNRTFQSKTSDNGFAIIDGYYYGDGNEENSELISPVFDLSGYSSIIVGFEQLYVNNYPSEGVFSYSIDGGTSWSIIQSWQSAYEHGLNEFDLTAEIAGQSHVQFKWSYSGEYSGYWAIDDFYVTHGTDDCQKIDQFPYMQDFEPNFIPVCWQTLDNLGNEQTWEFNYADVTYINSKTNENGYAILDSEKFGAGSSQDADLISPLFDFSGYTSVLTGFQHYFKASGSSVGTFSYSIDGGTSWQIIETWTSSDNAEMFEIDLSAGLAGQSEVYFKWNFTGANDYYWAIDDFCVAFGLQDCPIIDQLPFSEEFVKSSFHTCWQIVDNIGNGQVWSYENTGDRVLHSETGQNGFVILDSREYGPGNNQNSDLISPVFDLTGFNNIFLYFEHYYYHTSGSQGTLSYSIDNGNTWTEINQWVSSTANVEYFQIDLSDELHGQSEVRFKWNYTGSYGVCWAIDDIKISEQGIPYGGVSEEEYNALIAFYSSTNGDQWTSNRNWLKGLVQNWYGVTVNNGHVSEIKLGINNLSGNIPGEIGNMPYLQVLNLWNNNIGGGIPPEISNLTHLKELNLSYNNINGEITGEILDLVNLQILILAGNELSGILPSEIGQLKNLNVLILRSNSFTGTIPAELWEFPLLKILDLSYNSLLGHLPPQIGNLTALESLYLNHNQFSGTLPPEIGQLFLLQNINLENNNYEGGIPNELGDLSNLSYLDLSYNSLSGSIPVEFGDLSNLITLDLSDNSLSGSIPTEFGNLHNLRYAYMSNNSFSGPLPPAIGNLSRLINLNLSSNSITGILPTEIGNLNHLSSLRLSHNSISGALPPDIGNLNNLSVLNLSNNNISGVLPPEIGSMYNLISLYLNNNNMSGSLPDEIGELTNLMYLYLSDNSFSGQIPTTVSNNVKLTYLVLNNNNFTGAIPVEFSSLLELKVFRLNQNGLIDLPDLSGLNLITLSVNDNELTFEDLEPNISVLTIYTPQKKVPVAKDTIYAGLNYNLKLNIDVGGENNLYQWFKGDDAITALSDNPEYFIETANANDAGKYTCRITNTIVPYLTLKTDTISVFVVPIEEQTVVLDAGWNIFSSNLAPTDNSCEAVIDGSGVASNINIVKNETGAAYFPSLGFGGFSSFDIGEGYQIKLVSDGEFTFTGVPLVPEDEFLTLDIGWNMLGYLRQTSGVLTDILDPILNSIEIIKDVEGRAHYPALNFGTLNTLEPGKGYQVKMITSRSFSYPANDAKSGLAKPNFVEEPQQFSTPINTGSNMTLIIPENAWDIAPENGDEIAVFAPDGRLVGSAVLKNTHNMLPVFGNDLTSEIKDGLSDGEAFTLQLWHKSSGEIQSLEVTNWQDWAPGQQIYQHNGIAVVGQIKTGSSVTGIDSETAKMIISIYPNPVKDELNIHFNTKRHSNCSISIYNSIGQCVKNISGISIAQQLVKVNTQRFTPGVYVVKIMGVDGVKNISFIKSAK